MKNFLENVRRYIVLTFFPLGTLIALMAYYAVDIPRADEWVIVPLIEKFYSGTLKFADFFAQHNEHRIVTGKVIMLLNAVLTNWNMYIEMAINVVFAMGTSIVIYYSVEKITGIEQKKKNILYFASAWIIFSFTQQECYLWGFMMQLFMSVFFNVLAVFLLVYGESILFPIILAVLAEFSFANGMLIWPVGLMLLCLTAYAAKKKMNYGRIFLWLAASVIFISLYFYDFNYGTLRSPILENIKFLLTHPHMVIIPFVTYLGSPLSSYRQSIAIAAGTIGFAAQLYCLFIITKYKGWDKNKLFWLGADMYVLLSAAVTAYGRSTSISAAMALRYVPANMLFWVVTPVLLFITLEMKNRISFKWYVIVSAIILSLSVSEDALVRARETSETNSLFLQQLERGQYDNKFFTNNISSRNEADRIFSLKKYGIRHFGNAPENIVFDDFRPVTIELSAVSHDAALNVDEFKLHSGDFFTLNGYFQTEDNFTAEDMSRLKYSVILYNDANAFEAEMNNIPEERRHSVSAIFVHKNIYDTFHRSYFTGNQIYYGNLPEGRYNIAVKVISAGRDEKVFGFEWGIMH